MKKVISQTLLVMCLLPLNCTKTAHNDAEKLKAVVAAYYDGISNQDRDKMVSVTTDDFLLYEQGKIWNNDSVFKEMDVAPFKARFSFDGFRIAVDRMSGSMAYECHAHFIFNDTLRQDFDFVESAAFEKIHGTWKMSFLHVTEKTAPGR